MRIREVINEQGTTTKELAEKMGITLSALNQNISGNPSVRILEKIAAALGVPVWQLLVSPAEAKGDDLTALLEYRGNVYKAHSFDELERLIHELRPT